MMITELLITLLLGVVSSSLAQEPTWTQQFPTTSPSIRFCPRTAYDLVHNQLILFGGEFNRTYPSDTWVWDGVDWEKEVPVASPPGRCSHAMAYDAARGQVLLFGGQTFTQSGVGTNYNDTWVWDGSNWTQKFPAYSPPPMAGHSMVFDSARKKIVLSAPSNNLAGFNDTWTWDGSDWTFEDSSSRPVSRIYAAMAFDSLRNQAVLFGGIDWTSGNSLGDTWVWDGSNWTQKFPATSPRARSFAFSQGMAYDAARAQVLLFGGGLERLGASYETWVWDGLNWTQKLPATSPTVVAYAMVYDAARTNILLFGIGDEMQTWL
jgi:hypothetical protein